MKELRHKLVLSQRMMAKTLGLSEKTIEKWEQGANPVKGAASRLLYLLDKHPELIAELYQFQKFRQINLKKRVKIRVHLIKSNWFLVTVTGNK